MRLHREQAKEERAAAPWGQRARSEDRLQLLLFFDFRC